LFSSPQNWWARLRFAHPHMGVLSQGFSTGLSEVGVVRGRRAEPCVAQRDDRVPGKDWLPKFSAVHCITSYPVGLVWSGPTFRMLAARSPEDETHLQNGCLFGPWVARSSSIPRGLRPSAAPVRWFCSMPSSLPPQVRARWRGSATAPRSACARAPRWRCAWPACRHWRCGWRTSG
jgi:hypothetical protein